MRLTISKSNRNIYRHAFSRKQFHRLQDLKFKSQAICPFECVANKNVQRSCFSQFTGILEHNKSGLTSLTPLQFFYFTSFQKKKNSKKFYFLQNFFKIYFGFGFRRVSLSRIHANIAEDMSATRCFSSVYVFFNFDMGNEILAHYSP